MKNASCVNGTIEITLEQIQHNIVMNLQCQNWVVCVKALTTKGTVCMPLIGLSFLYIEIKELCEARVKPEMSSNLADETSLAEVPPFETASERSELFAELCHE